MLRFDPSFFPEPPFQVFSPPGYPFLPKPSFQVFDLPVYRFFYFHPLLLHEPFWFAGMPLFFPRPANLAGLWSCVVFSDYVHVHPVRRIVIVHSIKCCHTARRCLFNRVRFVAGIHVPFPKWFKWRSAPGYLTSLRDSLNLDLTSPGQLDTMSCPLIMKGVSLECISIWGDSSHWEDFCSLNIRLRISLLLNK